MGQETKPLDPRDGARADQHIGRQISMIGQQIDSRQIFQDGREVTIMHGQDIYRLRLTAQNKLILTK